MKTGVVGLVAERARDDDGPIQKDPAAVAHEERIRREKQLQFKQLKDGAQAIYGMVRGVPGARTPEQWGAMLEKAGDDLGNGRFIVRWLGAERYLDNEIVAALIALRQNLLADLPRATAAEIMMVDAAVLAYYNMLRVQGWMGDLSLVVERQLFGEEPLNQFHGQEVGNKLEEQIRRLSDVLLPLQDRASRIMLRSLEGLRHASQSAQRTRSQ